MSQPEHQAIVDELRSARIAASPELRARVRELAASVPASPPQRDHSRRRIAVVLVPAALAAGLVAALAVGLSSSGTSKRQANGELRQRGEQTPVPFAAEEKGAADSATAPSAKATGSTGTVPATTDRAQLYESQLTVHVADLSEATKRALRLTRGFHGYVRRVDYGSGTERASAHLVLRVPIGSVQAAIVEFSALGELLEQHVSIRDVQPTVDRRFRQMQPVRDSIATIQAKLKRRPLGADERKALENELVAERRRLVVLQRRQAALGRRTSYATVDLGLRTASGSR
jgi:Domain of unknown function (DUF4349)